MRCDGENSMMHREKVAESKGIGMLQECQMANMQRIVNDRFDLCPSQSSLSLTWPDTCTSTRETRKKIEEPSSMLRKSRCLFKVLKESKISKLEF